MKNTHLKQVVHTALFIALALVLRQFSFMIPMGGANGMRIGVSEVFTKMPAILFGPVFGGITSGLVDLLAQIIKSEGAYLWPIFFVMVLGGFITGFMWKWMKNISSSKLRIGFIAFCIALAVFGGYNHYILGVVQKGVWHDILLRLKENLVFATYGMYITSLLGIIFVIIDLIMKKKSPSSYNDDFLQLVLTIFISDIIVTTLNTFVLRFYYTGLARLPFWAVYIPRLIPDFVQVPLFAYIISCLLKVYRRVIKKQ